MSGLLRARGAHRAPRALAEAPPPPPAPAELCPDDLEMARARRVLAAVPRFDPADPGMAAYQLAIIADGLLAACQTLEARVRWCEGSHREGPS